MTARPAILPCMTSLAFLEYIQMHHAAPTTVVVCSTRELLLNELCASVSNINLDGETNYEDPHPFLVPTIHQLATSRTVHLTFAPTLPHLRAYLASVEPSLEPRLVARGRSTSQFLPTLAIFGLLELHRSTSEYSAQGLSRTFAIAAEAATAARRKLIVIEPLVSRLEEESVDATAVERINPLNPWSEQIPLLNGSIRLGDGDRVWAGRTVEAARVVSRWCHFVQLESETNG